MNLSIRAWCQILAHQCDGVAGTCTCPCHAPESTFGAILASSPPAQPSPPHGRSA
jgi:hypothetical protein